jgi:hypothetical protein
MEVNVVTCPIVSVRSTLSLDSTFNNLKSHPPKKKRLKSKKWPLSPRKLQNNLKVRVRVMLTVVPTMMNLQKRRKLQGDLREQ